MSKVSSGARKTNTAERQQNKTQSIVINRNALPFVGAFAGVLLSVPLSVALLSGVVRADVASALNGANQQTVSMKPAAATLSCVAPAGTTAGSPNKGTQSHATGAPTSSSSKAGSKTSPSAPVFVTKLVGGTLAKNDINVTNTGPNAKSVVVSKNEITNTNINNESNTTAQEANSGNAVVVGNQGATGNATTGAAANTNSTSFVENANN